MTDRRHLVECDCAECREEAERERRRGRKVSQQWKLPFGDKR